MRVVSPTNQFLQNNFNENTVNNQVDTLQSQKPLPKVPYMNTSDMMYITPISEGSTWNTVETPVYDPVIFTHGKDPQSYYQPFYNYPHQNQQRIVHPHYHHQQQQQQQQQVIYPTFQNQRQLLTSTLNSNSRSSSSNTNSIVGGYEWKTAVKQDSLIKNELQRSDSLKIQTVAPSNRFSSPLETHMEKPFEPPQNQTQLSLHKKASKQEIYSEDIPTDPPCLSEDSERLTEGDEEDTDSAASLSAVEKFFEESDASSASLPSLAKFCEPVKHKLSIASCSLINDKSNIKLYRRMAIKTRSTETQLAYAKYLIQISKLYHHSMQPMSVKSQQSETPAQIRYRLLLEAGYWIERLAKSSLPEALFIQGKWYLMGPQAEDCVIYTRPQETKALHCFVRASRGGWSDAHFELGNLWKRKGNFKRAVYYYDIGAKDNHTPSIYKMAKIFLRGQLKMNKDLAKGIDYLLKAANMNDPASAEPAFVVACIYANEFDRIGVNSHDDGKLITKLIEIEGESSESLALKYLKKSTRFDYVNAIYFMAQAYEKGMLGQPSDTWQAYQYYMKAAEMNHPLAMLDLARIYFEGIPGSLASQKDFAFKWCKRAANYGYDQAEYTLGRYYEDGIGTLPDFPLALEYYGRAASKGYQPAAEKLNRPTAERKQTNHTPVRHDNESEQIYFLKNTTQSKSKPTKSNQSNSYCHIQ